MADEASLRRAGHPAPHRNRVSIGWLLAALFAPPIGWSLHLIANYALASHSCYPGSVPKSPTSPAGLWALLIAIDVVSLAISLAAIVFAYRAWQASIREMAQHESPMVETGEGRTRFLAVWALLIGSLFFLTVASDSAALWILKTCS
ncbi:conserved membrane hypothetical protein [Bradyrhizobium sp. STM 3843]|uniref:hypothetical protein n=1 Tax=Bradyrhizobium sp. STM 3843 TaxID=551947 RepID=UPI0002404CF6|nr:hypothetical protein [Bradyrhizobium sp. STM 3843]CCE10497.1 conserved membrane hypothetical protein [Bradyrhizobium sp. STM 3843]